MSVNVRSKRRSRAMTARGRGIFHIVFAVLLAAAIGFGPFALNWASRDAALAAAFAAAPACPPDTVPAGDCAGWEQEKVSSIEPSRGSVGVHLTPGGQTLWFQGTDDAWPAGLTPGISVPVLVWKNEPQALREPTGKVHYSDGSAGHSRYDDIAYALCPLGFVLSMYIWFGALDVPPLRIRRPRLWLSLNVIGASAGAGLFMAGATIQDVRSVDPGIIAGIIVFASVALITTGIVELLRRNRPKHADARQE